MKKARRMTGKGLSGAARVGGSARGAAVAAGGSARGAALGGGGGPSPAVAQAAAAHGGAVFHEGWLSKRTEWKDGKAVKHMKYDRRYCTLTASALLVRASCRSRPPAPALLPSAGERLTRARAPGSTTRTTRPRRRGRRRPA